MEKWLKKKLLISLVFIIAFVQSLTIVKADTLNIEADAAILIEAETGKILYGKNIDSPLGIASMTKMMTEYLLLDAVKAGRVKWDQQYTVSQYVYKISQNRSLSNVPLEQDGKYNIRELYEAMAIYSANGATIALAEVLGGSEANFVQMMNKKATELGMKDFKFVNSSGLNNRDLQGMYVKGTDADGENVVSARDVARLAFHLYHDHPEILETASIARKKFRNIDMLNWNTMLKTMPHEYEGVDGIKTGSTDFAGYCFTGTAKRGDFRVISVVMNAKTDGKPSMKARFDQTQKMFDYGFSNFKQEEVLKANYAVKKQAKLKVEKGVKGDVAIHTKAAIKTIVRVGETPEFTPQLTLKKAKLTAPVKKATVVGTLTLKPSGDDLGFISTDGAKQLTVDVVTKASVEEASGFTLAMRAVGDFFANIWDSIMSIF